METLFSIASLSLLLAAGSATAAAKPAIRAGARHLGGSQHL